MRDNVGPKAKAAGSPRAGYVFHGDAAITTAAEDSLGFTGMADRIAEALLEQAGTRGFVLGIEGEWGAGKSSLLALVRERLRHLGGDGVASFEFRPWLIGDREQLLPSLLDSLSGAIARLESSAGDATRSTALAVTTVSEKVRRYARHLGPAGKLAGVAGTLLPGLGLLGDALQKMAEAAASESEGPTAAERKDELAASLQKLGRRVVVAVDDVDRLEPAEAGELLRLIRSVADFPNVAYVLCYDAERLARAIQTGSGVDDGRAFLEKIVQAEIALPRPESFALRRLFSSGLAEFAACNGDAGRRLTETIQTTGERCLGNARSVSRVLDSLRLSWPALKGRVDLADLVWLRMIAVAHPRLHRWVEEYVNASAAIATGRAIAGKGDRVRLLGRLDRALTADGLAWKDVEQEFQLILPRVGFAPSDGAEDRRIFAEGFLSDFEITRDGRLASPDHGRLYFALERPPGSVDLADVETLFRAADRSAEEATEILLGMTRETGGSGLSKAERMLDQLRHMPRERLASTNAVNLALAAVAAAESLGDLLGDEWGHPRAWVLARSVLITLCGTVGAAARKTLLAELFGRSPSMDILTHLLRDDTFDLGIHGGRPRSHEALTTRDDFPIARDAMFARYRELGVAGILTGTRPASRLYAWSQAGGREEVVAAIAEHVAGDDGRLQSVIEAIAGTARDEHGRGQSLSPEGLECFFDDVPNLLEQLQAASANGSPRAARILSAVNRSLSFENGSIERWITARRNSDGFSRRAPEGEVDEGGRRGAGPFAPDHHQDLAASLPRPT